MNIRALTACVCLSSALLPPLAQAEKPAEMTLKPTSSLMTQQEQEEYLAKLQAATTIEERDQIRKEYYEKMTERATGEKLDLPTEAPASGGMAE